jgi:hypothetical protein
MFELARNSPTLLTAQVRRATVSLQVN